MNKNMLDESKIGEREQRPALKCEECGMLIEDELDVNGGHTEWNNVDDYGVCFDCYKKYQDPSY